MKTTNMNNANAAIENELSIVYKHPEMQVKQRMQKLVDQE